MTIERLLEIAVTVNPGFYLIAAAALAAMARGSAARAVVLIGAPLLALGVLLYPPLSGAEVSRSSFLGFELALYRPDSLSLVFGLGFVLAALLCGIYSLHREDRVQDAAGLVLAGAALAAAFVGDLVSLVVFWEIVGLGSALLVFAGRGTAEGRGAGAAGMRYLVMQMVSGLLLMAGVAMYGVHAGTFLLAELGPLREGVLVGVFDIRAPGALAILAGVGIKAAFPLVHNWTTDAYSSASETGSVIVSAYTATLAVYVLARGFAGLEWLIWIGAAMAAFPVFFAVMENDLRKVLAYSSVNQIGFMVCAVGIGTPLALNGAAAHAVAHIVFKGLLFMSMGAVLLRLGTTRATELGGLHRTMPYTTLFCLVGAASISAFPLFAGFASKSMILSATHAGPDLYGVWLVLLFASAGVLEHSGIKIPYFAFFSRDSGKRPAEAPFNMLLAMGLAAALCLAIGLSPGWFYELMPYQDRAREYLALDLFTPAHILQQLQVLLFAVLAFLLLKRFRLHPPPQEGVILDAEWLWRKAAPVVLRRATPAVVVVSRHASEAGARLSARVLGGARQVLAPSGAVSRNFPLAAGAVWTACLLAFVVFVVMFDPL
ncbi:MAG: Na(+)/H(+) antiporter subunit D [Alphaproteobacteria bacterium]|nr:Na(+)/H(+) antiporter subunit D [Alphaproteobacteria bacterium]